MVSAYERIQGVDFIVLLLSFVFLLGFTFALYYLLFLLTNDFFKASILVILIGIPLIFFNVFFNVVLKYAPFLARFRYIIILTIAIFTILIVLVLQSKKSFKNISYYLNTLFVCLIIYNIIIISFNLNVLSVETTIDDRKTTVHNYNNIKVNLDYIPDIYYILLDSYTSSESLMKFWNYDNRLFEHSLQERGFYIASISKSFHPSTIISIVSTLNMTNDKNLLTENGTKLLELIKDSKVIQKLEKMGYNIRNLSIFDIGSKRKYYGAFLVENLIELDSYNSLLTIYKKIFENSLPTILNNFISQQRQGEIIKKIFSSLPVSMEDKKIFNFTYAHFMIPHNPGKFDREGNIIPFFKRSSTPKTYLDQLIATNKYVLKEVDNILNQYDTEKRPIIIIQGDHGYRYLTDFHKNVQEKNSIFSAYYLPSKGNLNLYSGISPYNIFRVIFNTYFDENYTLLPDLAN